MEVQGIGQILAPPVVSEPVGEILGRDDFFKLLVIQLRNQDPLNPMDDSAFIAQLAQFSQLEAVRAMSEKMDALSLSAQATQSLQMVGRQITFDVGEGRVGVGIVTAVRIGGDEPVLLVGDREVPISDVQVVE